MSVTNNIMLVPTKPPGAVEVKYSGSKLWIIIVTILSILSATKINQAIERRLLYFKRMMTRNKNTTIWDPPHN